MTPLGGARERRSHHKSLLILLGGRAKEDRDLCEAPQRVSVMSPTQLVHFLVIKFLLVMLLASNWSPTFLLSQDILLTDVHGSDTFSNESVAGGRERDIC